MNEFPLVSVILPTHNRASLLGRAVASVLSQTYRHLELIVVDDGSRDETLQILLSISDSRLRILHHEESKGAAAARNTGISNARGDFIAFQDSDDEWFQEKIERQMEVFRGATAPLGMVSCGFWLQVDMDRKYFPYKRFRVLGGDVYHTLIWENFLDTPSLLIKKACLEQVGFFDEKLPRFQDWELCLRLSRICQLGFVNAPLYISHSQPASISTNSSAGLCALQIIIEKNQEPILTDNRLHAHFIHWLGMLYMDNKSVLQARRHFRKAIACCRSVPKYYLSYLLSYLGYNLFNLVINCYINRKNR